MNTITIPKNLAKNHDLLVVEKDSFDKLEKDNFELRSAIKAILAGELALRRGKTRTFKQFLKARFAKYAKSY